MSDKTDAHRDIEETDELLEAEEAAPVRFWEEKQRELLTSVVDYNLSTLSDLVKAKTIDLQPKYQRRFRWDENRQSKLIESFLMNVPVPPVFLNEDKYGKYSVIDGKQRLTAIHDFMMGRLRLRNLEVFADINNLTFDELPPDFQAVIKTRPTIRIIIVLRQSDVDIKFEVFKRLNTGGVKLNAQEIRNSTYPGPLNDMLLDLSEYPLFHKLLGIKSKTESAIYQEMRDVEFLLRFCVFKDTWQTFTSRLQSALDDFMVANQKMAKKKLDQLREDFLDTLKAIEAAFGERAFQRWQPEKQQWRRQVLASLFDAQMFGCYKLKPERLLANRDAIITGLKALFEDDRFQQAITTGTNTPALFQYRVAKVRDLLLPFGGGVA
jgi:hypothetical protein